MRFEIRPLGPWLAPQTADRRSSSRFRASWQSTLDLLAKETELLGAAIVVLQVDVTEGDLRRDGMLRANAKVGFPGVRVSFESKHGPLTYAIDTYDRTYTYDPRPAGNPMSGPSHSRWKRCAPSTGTALPNAASSTPAGGRSNLPIAQRRP